MLKTYIIATILIVGILLWIGDDSKKAIADCKAAGVQSDETCEFYAR